MATADDLLDAFRKGYARGAEPGAVENDLLGRTNRLAFRKQDGLLHPSLRIIIAWNSGYNYGWAVRQLRTLCSGEPTP